MTQCSSVYSLQSRSSDPSLQSLAPSQTYDVGMQPQTYDVGMQPATLPQANCPGEHLNSTAKYTCHKSEWRFLVLWNICYNFEEFLKFPRSDGAKKRISKITFHALLRYHPFTFFCSILLKIRISNLVDHRDRFLFFCGVHSVLAIIDLFVTRRLSMRNQWRFALSQLVKLHKSQNALCG